MINVINTPIFTEVPSQPEVSNEKDASDDISVSEEENEGTVFWCQYL